MQADGWAPGTRPGIILLSLSSDPHFLPRPSPQHHTTKPRRADLSSGCGEALFSSDVAAADSIDLQFPLKTACADELRRLCKAVPHAGGRATRCLQRVADENAGVLGDTCAKALEAHAAAAAADYRLNFRLARACNATVGALCGAACPTFKGVLRPWRRAAGNWSWGAGFCEAFFRGR